MPSILGLSIGNRQSLVARIARLESAKTRLQRHFVHFGDDYTGTNSSDSFGERSNCIRKLYILTGAVINADYIESRQFLGDTGCAVLEPVRYRETTV